MHLRHVQVLTLHALYHLVQITFRAYRLLKSIRLLLVGRISLVSESSSELSFLSNQVVLGLLLTMTALEGSNGLSLAESRGV
mmetsp:Transcript_44077/g.139074  ORF Transcript_44077/g.139074 Transcript_44077/m.139074 type:complete len:82 (+) Transcript_44077:908-1153(+)